MKALPIRLLLIAGLWMPMVHSHAPEWMRFVRDGITLDLGASADSVTAGLRGGHDANTRHSVEADHDHCPICALQTLAPDFVSSGGRTPQPALDLLLGDAADEAHSRLHVSYAGRAPPRLV